MGCERLSLACSVAARGVDPGGGSVRCLLCRIVARMRIANARGSIIRDLDQVLVGIANINRLDRPDGADGGGGGCEVHNPGYDFNDAALPLGASLFARLAERKLAPE